MLSLLFLLLFLLVILLWPAGGKVGTVGGRGNLAQRVEMVVCMREVCDYKLFFSPRSHRRPKTGHAHTAVRQRLLAIDFRTKAEVLVHIR